jgi:transcriptional regulator with XRE-family HTH domain
MAQFDRPRVLGELLRSHRKRAGMTQRQLADLSTLSERAVRNLESGKALQPRQVTTDLLAAALRLSSLEHQALVAATRPPPLIEPSVQTPASPPAQIDPLIGREHERRALIELLDSRTQRWITVVGLSGVGKTKLAMDVARNLHDRERASVLWLDPAATSKSTSSLPAKRLVELLTEPEFDLGQAAACARDRNTLLVIDDYQRLEVPDQRILAMLQHAPHLRVLATARSPFQTPGECLFPLAPLVLPTTEDERDVHRLEEVPAVQLLMLFLQQIRPDLTLTDEDLPLAADLCRRLDGLPAALHCTARWALSHSLRDLTSLLERDPLATVTTAPGRSLAGCELDRSLRSALSALTIEARSLMKLLVVKPRWTIADLAVACHRTLAETANGLHQLLLHGLVRRVEGSHAQFALLNLVRIIQSSQVSS